MAFKSEEERLRYEAEMQAFHERTRQQYSQPSNRNAQRRPVRMLTEGEKVNLNINSNISSGGGCAMILLGVPCLLFPPLGLFLIALGIVSMVLAVRDSARLEEDKRRLD